MVARLIVCAAWLLAAASQAAEFTYTETDNSAGNIALGFWPPEPVDTTVAGDYFRSYDGLAARHLELMLESDGIRRYRLGGTWKGEDIWGYRFGDHDDRAIDDETPEGAVMINGSIHAREWQSQEAVTGLMEYLVAVQDDDGIGTYLSDNLDIFILPVQNIDGFRQTQRYWNKVTNTVQQPRDGRMRRKNMRAPDDSAVDELLSTSGDNLYGVDLNRNSEHGFGAPNDSSSDVTSLVYKGTAPISEPESEALQAFVERVPSGQLRFYEDVHSFSQLMFVPQTGDAVRDENARSLAYSMSNAVDGRYDVYPDPIGGGIGATSDHFAYIHGAISWTLELEPRFTSGARQYGGIGVSHDGFILPDSEVARLRDEFNRMHTVVFYEMAGPVIVREIAIRRIDTGEVVYAADWRRANDQERELHVSVDTTLSPDFEYELWVAFSKPMHDETIDALRAGAVHLVDAAGEVDHMVVNPTVNPPDWLADAGGTFDGYRRYRHDAFRATFGVPHDVPDGSAERRMLVINAIDFAKRMPDADPATIAGFSNGKWTAYERYPGVANTSAEVGNLDCNFMISVGSNTDTVAPAGNRSDCTQYLESLDPEPPPPAAEPPPPRKRGGGTLSVVLLLLLSIFRTFRAARVKGI